MLIRSRQKEDYCLKQNPTPQLWNADQKQRGDYCLKQNPTPQLWNADQKQKRGDKCLKQDPSPQLWNADQMQKRDRLLSETRSNSPTSLSQAQYFNHYRNHQGLSIPSRGTLTSMSANTIPSTGHENNTAQPEAGKRLSSPSYFSSFFTILLLSKCCTVAW